MVLVISENYAILVYSDLVRIEKAKKVCSSQVKYR